MAQQKKPDNLMSMTTYPVGFFRTQKTEADLRAFRELSRRPSRPADDFRPVRVSPPYARKKKSVRMKIRNTSKHSAEWVAFVLGFALESVRRNVKALGLTCKPGFVIVRGTTPGRRRGEAVSSPGGRVVVYFPPIFWKEYPKTETYYRFDNMPRYTVFSDIEAAIHLAAHEFRHVAGADGDRAGEVACERAGGRAVSEYRDLFLISADENPLLD